jgi:quinol monooxygenase YgiN
MVNVIGDRCMILMRIATKVGTQRRDEFLQAVHSLICTPDKPRGLRQVTFYREVKDPAGFSLIYEWNDQEEMDRYLSKEEFRVLLGALKVLSEGSNISFMRVSEECSGLEIYKKNHLGY